MALFSRRKKPGPTHDEGARPDAESVAADEDAATGAEEGAPQEPVANVGISVSTFRGVGAAAAPGSSAGEQAAAPAPQQVDAARQPHGSAGEQAGRPSPPGSAPVATPRGPGPETAPPPTESVPGLRDNVLLREALAALSSPPTAQDLINVARQLLQGHVFLRVKGDARALLAEGKQLPLAVATRGDRQLVLAYSSGAALQNSIRADGDTGASAVGQPALTLLRHALAGPYEGIVIDHGSEPARAILPRPVLQRALDEAHEKLSIKTLLAAPRTAATAAEVAAALTEAPLWIAVKRTEDGGPVGVAEARTTDGRRWLEVYSHPLELLVLGRGDQPLPLRAEQLAKALQSDSDLAGVLVDQAGPWIRLGRDDLAPVLALA